MPAMMEHGATGQIPAVEEIASFMLEKIALTQTPAPTTVVMKQLTSVIIFQPGSVVPTPIAMMETHAQAIFAIAPALAPPVPILMTQILTMTDMTAIPVAGMIVMTAALPSIPAPRRFAGMGLMMTAQAAMQRVPRLMMEGAETTVAGAWFRRGRLGVIRRWPGACIWRPCWQPFGSGEGWYGAGPGFEESIF
jgi:hypothetical protein